ncbi:MAG: fabA-like domain protein, partial [Xanthomonadaceae bacterium]|nr:fabA-like domain protein [Xanthomonadaceae bacterium]
MQFSIPATHPSLPGHFPGRPIVPGVLILERVIDAIEAAQGPLGTLRLPQVKFVQPLLPGEIAEVSLAEVSLAEMSGGDVVLDGVAQRWRFRVTRG